jgi:RNA polymerase sigma factor for flagellar operon FliA
MPVMVMVVSRDRLIEEHLPLVRSIASKLKRRFRKTMEPGDLVAYGTEGLLDAARNFDPSRGTSFSTFAYYRIRGAIFDGMRTMGWYSRSDYVRFRAAERAHAYLAAAADQDGARKVAGADAPKSDPAQVLGEIADLLGGVAAVHITSLEGEPELADHQGKLPDEALEKSQERNRVRKAIESLPSKERRLIEFYYLADLNLEEAGAKLGLSKSWASRLHARAVNLLREALQGDGL